MRMTDIEKKEIGKRGFSRRSFIKGALIVGAAGALTGCSAQSGSLGEDSAAEVPETKIYSGACRAQCLNGCYLNVHVRDGKVVRTTAGDFPEPEYNRICPKGLSHVERIYSSERLQYPMRRVGERGEGKFERISWDEAIGEIAEKWKGYVDEFGPTSIVYFMGSGNTGVCACGQEVASAQHRLREATGAAKVSTDRDAAMGYIFGKMLGGSGNWVWANEATDMINANVIVQWGSNTAVSNKQTTHFIFDAKEKGAKIVDIDINYNTNAAKSDWFVPVKPSTDAALALGAIHEVLEQGWEDIDFLRKSTEAPFLIKEDGGYLRMSDLGVPATEGPINPQTKQPTIIDPYVVWDEDSQQALPAAQATKPALTDAPEIKGFKCMTVYEGIKERAKDWTPEKASEVCGVSVEDIKELARMYAQDGPITTFIQYGVNHYNNGPYSYSSIVSLILLTGNAGKAGAGIGAPQLFNGRSNMAGIIMAPGVDGTRPRGTGPQLNWYAIPDIVETQQLNGKPYPLKSIWCAVTNPVVSQTEHKRTVKMFKDIEFVVVQEMAMTETAKYADILLPACHWFEYTDVRTRSTSTPFLIWNDKAVEPLYESKSDFHIFKMIADAMGVENWFPWEEPEDFLKVYLDSDGLKALGVTYDSLKENKVMRAIPKEGAVYAEGGKFPSESTRARFYTANPVPQYNIGQEFDPSKEKWALYWEPSLEADPALPIHEKYPFSCCSDHMRTRTHGQWWDAHSMKEYEPYPTVRMNPDDAKELGIEDGDKVRVYNDRGTVTLIATLHAGQMPKTVGCNRSWQASEFIDGHLCDLSFAKYNQGCANQAYNDVAVAIEKL